MIDSNEKRKESIFPFSSKQFLISHYTSPIKHVSHSKKQTSIRFLPKSSQLRFRKDEYIVDRSVEWVFRVDVSVSQSNIRIETFRSNDCIATTTHETTTRIYSMATRASGMEDRITTRYEKMGGIDNGQGKFPAIFTETK